MLDVPGSRIRQPVALGTPAGRWLVAVTVLASGMAFLDSTAVQVALPRKYLGVASSQIQFWRNLGGTVGSAILGAVLANRLPDYLASRVSSLHLPPQLTGHLPPGGANAILQPAVLAQLPPAFVSAIRYALSDTLHDIYVFAGAILIVALVSTVFMKEVPLTSAPASTGFGEAAPVEEEDRESVPA